MAPPPHWPAAAPPPPTGHFVHELAPVPHPLQKQFSGQGAAPVFHQQPEVFRLPLHPGPKPQALHRQQGTAAAGGKISSSSRSSKKRLRRIHHQQIACPRHQEQISQPVFHVTLPAAPGPAPSAALPASHPAPSRGPPGPGRSGSAGAPPHPGTGCGHPPAAHSPGR